MSRVGIWSVLFWMIVSLTISLAPATSFRRNLILGGGIAPKHKYSFIVGLRARVGDVVSENLCGGSLIAPKLVLTAAHCIHENNITIATIGSRTNAKTDEGEHIEIAYKIQKSDFNFTSIELGMDIAILVLVKSSTLGYPVLLPPTDETFPNPNATLTFIGWGRSSDLMEVYAPLLKEVHLKIIPSNECVGPDGDEFHHVPIQPNQLCAAWNNIGICDGDSGSPLIYIDENDGTATVVGIDSFGLRKKCGISPEVFTRVQTFIPFIKKVLNAYSSPYLTSASIKSHRRKIAREDTPHPGSIQCAVDGAIVESIADPFRDDCMQSYSLALPTREQPLVPLTSTMISEAYNNRPEEKKRLFENSLSSPNTKTLLKEMSLSTISFLPELDLSRNSVSSSLNKGSGSNHDIFGSQSNSRTVTQLHKHGAFKDNQPSLCSLLKETLVMDSSTEDRKRRRRKHSIYDKVDDLTGCSLGGAGYHHHLSLSVKQRLEGYANIDARRNKLKLLYLQDLETLENWLPRK